MSESVLREKSYAFAIRIVEMNRFLCSEKKEYVLSKQVLRSGTAIGALIHEAEFGQSTPDFRTKFTIALKEANETQYWLRLLTDTRYLDERFFSSISNDCLELIRMLVATIKTLKIREEAERLAKRSGRKL
ncbi:four helix bundle protein [soil metagenome]